MDSFPETHNNPQRLRSAEDFHASDRRSKRTCANTVCASIYFHVIEGQNAITRLQEIEGTNVRAQIAFSVFHLFLVEDQTNGGYIRAKPAPSKPGPSCSKLGQDNPGLVRD